MKVKSSEVRPWKGLNCNRKYPEVKMLWGELRHVVSNSKRRTRGITPKVNVETTYLGFQWGYYRWGTTSVGNSADGR